MKLLEGIKMTKKLKIKNKLIDNKNSYFVSKIQIRRF